MTSQCLNNLFLFYTHIPQTDAADIVSIAREFLSVYSRQLDYFGKILDSIVCCFIILVIILVIMLVCKE